MIMFGSLRREVERERVEKVEKGVERRKRALSILVILGVVILVIVLWFLVLGVVVC